MGKFFRLLDQAIDERVYSNRLMKNFLVFFPGQEANISCDDQLILQFGNASLSHRIKLNLLSIRLSTKTLCDIRRDGYSASPHLAHKAKYFLFRK